jgi:hypothetical protein
MPSDGPSARWNSNYEAIVVLRMEANIIQAKAMLSKGEANIHKDTANFFCRELKVLDNRLAIT